MILRLIGSLLIGACAVACDEDPVRGAPDAAAPSLDAGTLPVAMDAEVQQDSGNPVDAAKDASAPSLQLDAEPPDATVPDGAAEDVTDAGSPEDVYEHVRPGQGVSSDPLCDQIKACGGDITINYGQICRARLGAVVSDACFAAVQAAPCSDHEIENPPYMDVCHPPCEDIGSWCNNDLTASACRPLPAVDSNAVIPRWYTVSCTTVCELGGSFAVDCEDLPSGVADCICDDDR